MTTKAKGSKNRVKAPREETDDDAEERLTLEVLDAVSTDEEDGMGDVDEAEWNAEALALRQAIADGAFDHLMKKAQKKGGGDTGEDDADDDDEDDDDEEEAEEVDMDEDDEGSGEESKDSDESDSDEEEDRVAKADANSAKALVSVLEDMTAAKRDMPWAETFDVIPEEPLPFGGISKEGSPLDVHDDLKREVAFYNVALESVKLARTLCGEAGIPFSRPEDFFAEMVKSDDHMAKVKDRLIFETKKMDAVAQRKSNKEQKLRAKEKHANKLAEKAKRKKENLKAVDDWAKTAASSRGGALQEDDDAFLTRMGDKRKGWTDRDGNLQTGPNKKRMTADKKYGHGGKRGRFKQNDPKSLNDMSGFNPRGNFSGGTKSRGGSGASRKGKRARDAGRARR